MASILSLWISIIRRSRREARKCHTTTRSTAQPNTQNRANNSGSIVPPSLDGLMMGLPPASVARVGQRLLEDGPLAMGSRSGRREAALGFRAHSGWAALVAVAGPAAEPVVAVRRRVELSRRTPRQPFHAAEGRPFAAAEALIRRATDEATALAERAVREAVAELRAAGHEPVASGVLLAAGRPLPGLREVLASHALIHAAEGELFREALRQASERCGLLVTHVKEKELDERAAQALGRSAAEQGRQLAAWGKALGPPWTQDQKRAALVAWLALAAGLEVPQSRRT